MLRGILPKHYISHFALLVAGIYIFSSQHISFQNFLLGERLLLQFYKEFSSLYSELIQLQYCFVILLLYSSTCIYIVGVKSTSMNVHLLHHLPHCVKLWGPLWAYSCFHFESMNGYLKFLFHGTKDMSRQVYFSSAVNNMNYELYVYLFHSHVYVLQLAFSYIVMQELPPTLNHFTHSSNALSAFARIIYGKKKYVQQNCVSNVLIIQMYLLCTELSSRLLQLRFLF